MTTQEQETKSKTEMELIPPTERYVEMAEAKSLEFMNPKRWQVMKAMSDTFINSGAVPASIKNSAQMMMVMQAGYEAGMQPLESLNAFYIVNGKLTMYGDAVTSQVLKAGHIVEWGTCDDKTATVTITRGDNGAKMTGTFTIEEATRKGLLQTAQGNVNTFWQKYPENMLKYKALGKIVDFIVPDALRGISVKEVIEADMGDDTTSPAHNAGSSPLAVATAAIAEEVNDAPAPVKTTGSKPFTLAEKIAASKAAKEAPAPAKPKVTKKKAAKKNGK